MKYKILNKLILGLEILCVIAILGLSLMILRIIYIKAIHAINNNSATISIIGE